MSIDTHPALTASRQDAARRLSGLIMLETGIEITPDQVLNLVLGNWDRVAALAHQIHGTEKKADDALPDADLWTEWRGDGQPCADTLLVEVLRFDGQGSRQRAVGPAKAFNWQPHGLNPVTHYRVVKP